MTVFRPYVTPAEAARRLEMIFPRSAFDTILSSPTAGAAIVTQIFVGALADEEGNLLPDAIWARPSMCMWMSDEALAHGSEQDRRSWRTEAARHRGKKAVIALLARWGDPFDPRYADNSRENVRDEAFPEFVEHGAMRKLVGVKTSSSVGRWALEQSFAALFDPALDGDALIEAIESWKERSLSPGAKLKAMIAQQRAAQLHEVSVTLPDGRTRTLEPGDTSVILKGVIEQWAPVRLGHPVVLAISEPGDKLFTGDAEVLRRLGIQLDVNEVLPDALLADASESPVKFWIVEAVYTDGPVSESRRATLLEWAERQNIPRKDCFFLTAFISRGDSATKRRLKDLAVGTFAWFVDEPSHELAWYELGGG